jgi:hypothetical protein
MRAESCSNLPKYTRRLLSIRNNYIIQGTRACARTNQLLVVVRYLRVWSGRSPAAAGMHCAAAAIEVAEHQRRFWWNHVCAFVVNKTRLEHYLIHSRDVRRDIKGEKPVGRIHPREKWKHRCPIYIRWKIFVRVSIKLRLVNDRSGTFRNCSCPLHEREGVKALLAFRRAMKLCFYWRQSQNCGTVK